MRNSPDALGKLGITSPLRNSSRDIARRFFALAEDSSPTAKGQKTRRKKHSFGPTGTSVVSTKAISQGG
jgi:hypothetical protein